ncbi:MAG: hypothetical protein HBSAPP03_25140 [Phycisphaerae bacterium]|nr:MAG: hypothetical protein HBSAPP03_25140 [Phycisphaerae bacterium]
MNQVVAPQCRNRSGYTLVELLIVVTVMGIAGALIVPSFASTDALRVQGALRSMVADITEAQSDAIAFQRGRAMVFFPDEHRYVIAEVNGTTIDLALDRLDERRLNIDMFGFTRITGITFPNDMLVFDELGGPVTAPQSTVAAPEAWVDLSGSSQNFRLRVEAYTGRVTVQRLSP